MRVAEATIRRYLLGDLPEDEEQALEDRFAQDDALFATVEAVEDEIIDDYVRDRLASHERARCEERLLASPGQHERVAFARALAARTAATPAPRRASAAPRRRLAPLLAWAAVLLLAAGLGLTVRETRVLDAALRDSGARERAALGQAEALRRQLEVLERQHVPADVQTPRRVLRSGWERGAAPERPFAAGSHAWVRLDLLLDVPPHEQDRFQVSIETPEGRVAVDQAGLAAGTVDGRPALSLLLPTRLLPRGTCIVSVRVRRGAATSSVASYRLLVER